MLYNVLIVEDHPFQYEYLLNLFKEFGNVRVEAACDGQSALKRLDEVDFDLVLTDLVMPGMDGVQFIQQLASRTLKPALAIMSSASQRMIISASLVAQSLGLKVIGQLSKPVLSGSVHKLMKELDTWLGASRTLDISLPVFSREMLQEALAAEVLQAWFQPKKSLANGRIISAEALARWPHPQHGLLMPADFLPAVVRFGLEEPLLMLFVKQTILAQSRWRKQGY
ncbi:response regulator, partial [Pseudomonas sp. TH05]|nr:response regulator [Pseudomonas sp. TH05]